ncbi:M24 family metallopeptidase [Neoroseomonas lacus]|uniref:Peptidase n=1 Tax=Neoroseomonas lacus TaxID=287609 RepID=A0A917KMC5_9PROT|nr:Xaa-Pro peptidase family protein [Neoroseomonas lacus]GGJ18232.1 peptidase [Neoroseomonas lacus]
MNIIERGVEAVFPAAEYQARQARVRQALVARGLDAAIFTGPENIFWLTSQQTPGYYTFQCLILPVAGEPIFLLRELELTNFLRNSFVTAFETYGDGVAPAGLLLAALDRLGLSRKRIAIEKGGWFLPISFYESLVEALPERPDDATGIVEQMRRVKSPGELAAIERAVAQSDAGMRAGLAAIRPGATENDIVAAMMQAAIAGGAEYMGMEPLVSSGPRSGVPHATWRRRRLEAGDAVFLEMSGCSDRYHSGLMRTAWLGEPPTLARDLERVVLAALEAAIGVAGPGRSCAEVHHAAQTVIDAAGMTDRYRKRSGYSLGVSFAPDWGEWQVMSLFDGVDVELEPGMCFHIPITLREWGAFTVGISESIVIAEGGCRQLGGTIPRGIHVIDCE